MGDLNIHHRKWLKYSSQGDTSLGSILQDTATAAGLKQMVKEPTRNDNLLDLAMTDMLDTQVEVGNKIQDHKWITATMPITEPTTKILHRQVWNYADADWERLNDSLSEVN